MRPAIAAAIAVLTVSSATADEVRFPDSHDPVPSGWTGQIFHLSQNYPTKPPVSSPMPWKAISFKKEPAEYVDAVFRYVREGNENVDWKPELNTVRPWYHAPWMHFGDSGREFIRGLTRERTTPRAVTGKGELGPDQTSCFQNWAVSIFNEQGGYHLGRVWQDPRLPDASSAEFSDGTVIAKLLFTAATVKEVPYLKGALEWQANVNDIPGSDSACRERTARKPQIVRLLQIDLAVRDQRADDEASPTGWVFATLIYDGSRNEHVPLDRMTPVGLMWGNDPGLAAGEQPKEGWINASLTIPQHLGFGGRLNGPVDNPISSCLSCHSTAQTPALSPMTPGNGTPPDRWFRNIAAGDAFDRRAVSTDYSLQVAMGIQNFRVWLRNMGGFYAPPPETSTTEMSTFSNRSAVELTDEADTLDLYGATEYRITRGH